MAGLIPYRFLFLEDYRSNLPDYVCVGRTTDNGVLLTLEDAERAMHMYVCGITGSGKSRFLSNMLVQDIALWHPLCLIDPTGFLYRQALEFVAHATEQAEREKHPREPLLAQYLFLDVDNPQNPLRLNPLEPQGTETTEEMADDLLKTAERLFGSVDETRRLRNILRTTLWVLIELNRLPEEKRPAVSSPYPLNLRFAYEFLTMGNEERQQLITAVPDSPLNAYVKTYWTRFFGRYTQYQAQERLESTWNILQYFLLDSLVSRFFDVERSSFHVAEVMQAGKSLFCHLPLGKNLKGSQVIGTFLATKFQRAAYRRSPGERHWPYYLYIDEMQEFCDIEFAKAAATLRQYGLRLILAHQSQSQPPFHTAEGKGILQTIKGNAGVKALFRLTREDAETMSKETFELTQRRFHFTYKERSTSVSKTRGTTRTVSFQRTRGTAKNWSRSSGEAIARTESFAIGKTLGTNIGETLTEGFGNTIARGLAASITASETRGVTEVHSKAHGISLALGENWSHMRNHALGFSFTRKEGESFAAQVGHSSGLTLGEQEGETNRSGTSYSVTDNQGTQLTRTEEKAAVRYGEFGVSSYTETEPSTALGELKSTGRTEGATYDKAMSQVRSIAGSLTESHSQTTGRDKSESRGVNVQAGESDGTGGSTTQTVSGTESVAYGKDHKVGQSRGETRSLTLSESQQKSLAKAFSLLEQFSKTFSEALQKTVSVTDAMGGSVQESTGEGEAIAEATGTGQTSTASEKKVYFTLEGEREITINDLQKLPRQRLVLTKTALAAVEIEALSVPDAFYTYRSRSYPDLILRLQAERFGERLEEGPETAASEFLPVEKEPVQPERGAFLEDEEDPFGF